MLFSSIPFLYTFLPCVLILYFLVPGWLKNTVLLLSSLFFYAWGEPRFVVFMVIAIVQGYVFGLLAEKFRDRPKRAKLCLWASAVVSLGLLGYCKYADFFISGRAVPPAAPCGPAHRHQLLHLPNSELRHRRIPGRCDCPAESH